MSRVIDTRARKLLAREPLPAATVRQEIVYDPATKETLSACANGVAVVPSDKGKLVASLQIEKASRWSAFDLRRHVALIPSGADGNVSIIELSPLPRVLATVPTPRALGQSPWIRRRGALSPGRRSPAGGWIGAAETNSGYVPDPGARASVLSAVTRQS